MLAHLRFISARARRPRLLLGLGILVRLSRERSARTAVVERAQGTYEHTLANAVDWAVAYSRHLYGAGHGITPEDVQLRAWADFNIDVSREEAVRAIMRYTAR